MFDLEARDGSVRTIPYHNPIPEGPARTGYERAGLHRLDTPGMIKLHNRLLGYYVTELDRQTDNRREMAIDDDFYDNIQYREEDARILKERGQAPIVYNQIAPALNWVIGTERRARTDHKVLPRRKEDAKPSERKSQLLKYLSDVNRDGFHVSRAFEDSVKVGVGWLEDAVEDSDESEPIVARAHSWRDILWDSTSTALDLSDDARYLFHSKWVDDDVLTAFFPDRRGLIERAAIDGDDFRSFDLYGDDAMDSQELWLDGLLRGTRSDLVTASRRRRLRAIGAWFRMPVATARLRGSVFHGELYDPYSAGHHDVLRTGTAALIEKPSMRMFCAIMVPAGFLWCGPSPYRHNRFPYTPIWAYRRGRDNLPYGMIRGMRDIQEDINKRASKALHILSTNKTIMDEGAVEDLDEFREEVARPDAIIIKKPGKELVINADRELTQWHLEMMHQAISMLQQRSGVTDELLGRRTNAVSGKAIERRQDQGSMQLAALFDNLRLAQQIRGEKKLSLVEQFVTEQKAFRITNMRGAPEYVVVNDGRPENDIVRTKADFVISEEDWNATLRQAAAESLLEIAARMPPEIALQIFDLIVENMDLPNREEIVRRIRAVTGQPDPDADEPTPEETAKAQAAARAKALQDATLMAQLRKLIAEGLEKEARARQIATKTVTDNVASQRQAVDAARETLATPEAAALADHILGEAGFKGQSEQEEEMREAAAAQEQAQQPQQAPPAPGIAPQS